MLLKIMYFYILLEISLFSFVSSELIATLVFPTEKLLKNVYYKVYQQSDYHKDINKTILAWSLMEVENMKVSIMCYYLLYIPSVTTFTW